jgi:alkanesulfonate monooxygenase SsuD/methylene tetrahydromethanopterin reductase-like flavin-dependent oxidoreductase (luciferase family)
VPVWVSGTLNPRAVRRLAAYGSAWIPWGAAAADLPTAIPAMKAALAEAGRTDTDGLQVVGSLPLVRDGDGFDLGATLAAAAPLVDAGVTDFRVGLRFTGSFDADLEVASGVVEGFRAAFRG